MDSRVRLRTFTLAAAFSLAFAACSGSTSSPSPSTPPSVGPSSATSPAPSASAAPTVGFTLKYGVLMSSTGDLAATGATWNHTIDLAMLTINNALKAQGLDSTIKLEKSAADDGGTAATGIEGANKLVKSDGVSVILGPCCSGVTVAVAQGVTIAANVPMFTIGSSPTISALDSKGTVFRTTPADNLQGGALAQFVSQQLGAGKMVNIGARNDAYGQGLATEFTKAYTALGGKVGLTVQWDPKQATFDTEAQKLVSNSPDGWVFFDYEQTFINVGAALARTGKFDGSKSFGADSLACNEGTVAVNKSCGAPVGMRGTQASVVGGSGYPFFQTVWQANLDPKVAYQGTFEPEGWDGAMISFLAALQGKSAAPADIVKNIHAVTDTGGTEYTAEHIGDAIKDILAGKKVKYVGATGPCVFNEHGDVSTSTFMVWWQQTKNAAAAYGKIPDIQYSPK
jgi:ABC-type branched-subunit amino acid transport system substrate-binding protein